MEWVNSVPLLFITYNDAIDFHFQLSIFSIEMTIGTSSFSVQHHPMEGWGGVAMLFQRVQ